jgi:hypothetical protein
MASIRLFVAATVVALLVARQAAAAAPPSSQDRLDQMHAALVEAMHNFQKNLDTPKADGTVRTYTHAAQYALAMGMDARTAEDFIRRAMARQDMDHASPKFGDVPWEMFANDIHDANSVEFTFAPIGPIMLGYADRLSPQFRAEMVPHIAGGIAAIRRHKVPVSYSNIYLMKTENLLLLGEAIGDQDAVATGRQLLDDWLQFTATHGVHEYASPTYTAVQLNCLLNAYRHTHLADVKPKLKAGLDYLWADAAASFIPPGDDMAGPHSRDYDFLRGTGSIDRFYYFCGLRNEFPAGSLFVDSFGAYVNELENGYRPSDQTLALAHLDERIVKARWDDTPGADRYAWITPDFAVGSTSAHYGPQDREVAVDLDLKGSANPIAMTLSADTLDAPYGKQTLKDRSGHQKPVRLRTDIAAVQDHGAVLALLNLSPDLPNTPTQSVATDILIPLTADQIVLDGQPIQLPAGVKQAESTSKSGAAAAVDDELRAWSHPAHRDSVLGVRCGDAGVAVRIFAADGVEGQEPVYLLKCDGAQWGAGRFVVYQYRGPQTRIEQKPIRAGVLLLCDHCANDGDFTNLIDRARMANIVQKLDGDAWDVQAQVGTNLSLESALNLKTGHPTIRRVDGKDYVPDRFSVNGRDLAAQILDPVINPH